MTLQLQSKIPVRHYNLLLSAILFFTIHITKSNSTMFTYENKAMNTIIIGGSSGMGKATALSTIIRGGDTLIVSRSQEKLDKAKDDILKSAREYHDKYKNHGNGNGINNCVSIGNVKTAVLDVTDEEAIQQFAQTHLSTNTNTNHDNDNDNDDSNNNNHNYYDALIFSAAGQAPHGPIHTLPTSSTRSLFETKFWGAYNSAKYISPHLKDGGCIIFISGVLNKRPGINCTPLASTNGALEGLTRALALELGSRLRVNCLSPGFCNTERFDHMERERREGMMRNTAESLPLKRVGDPSDMGEAIYHLLECKFVTGVVLDCDGGHHIRQYANIASDPMRK